MYYYNTLIRYKKESDTHSAVKRLIKKILSFYDVSYTEFWPEQWKSNILNVCKTKLYAKNIGKLIFKKRKKVTLVPQCSLTNAHINIAEQAVGFIIAFLT